MYTVLFKNDRHSIVECLRKLGHLPNIYSEKRKELGVLSGNKLLVYATEQELALVLDNHDNKEDYTEEEELVWDLAVTCELFRNRLLRLTKNVPHVFGVFVTKDNIADYDEMKPVWEVLDVAVIDNVDGIDYHSLPVNTNKELSVSFPLMFLYEAEFTEQDIAYAEYSLLSLINPDITHEERGEEMDFLREEFGIA